MDQICPKKLSSLTVHSYGFTLIELLVAICIMAIVAGYGASKYSEFNKTQIIKQAAQSLKSDLRSAQEKAQAGVKDCTGIFEGYRMAFAANRYIYRSQCSGGASLGAVTNVDLPSGVTITTFPVPNPFLFKPMAQGTDITSPTIILSAFGQTQTIQVTKTGVIQ